MTKSRKAPGKYFRRGLSITRLFKMFPDEASAEAWFIKQRWPDYIYCAHCGSSKVQTDAPHPSMPYRCRANSCRKFFSVKTGTVMHSTKLEYRTWIIALYMLQTSLKSVSSMKLHRELDITQKSAWHLAHRLRKAGTFQTGLFDGPIEVDETYVGGKRKNMPRSKRESMKGRGSVGKTAVVGMKDRESKWVNARVVGKTDGKTLKGFVYENTTLGAKVYTDDATAYEGLLNRESVKHSVGEYVRGQAHTNGIEGFWSMLKRAHMGTFHRMSPKHLQRYVDEFVSKQNIRGLDTETQMEFVAAGMNGKRLRYRDLIS